MCLLKLIAQSEVIAFIIINNYGCLSLTTPISSTLSSISSQQCCGPWYHRWRRHSTGGVVSCSVDGPSHWNSQRVIIAVMYSICTFIICMFYMYMYTYVTSLSASFIFLYIIIIFFVFISFLELIQKEWLDRGHPFSLWHCHVTSAPEKERAPLWWVGTYTCNILFLLFLNTVWQVNAFPDLNQFLELVLPCFHKYVHVLHV